MKPLTPKQEAFALAFVELGEAKAAAERAGYSHPKQYGHKLTHDDQFRHVQARIAELRGEARAEAKCDRRRRQELLSEIAEGRAADVTSAKERIAAIQLLGKMEGDYVERREVKHEGGSVHITLAPSDARELAKETGE